MTTRSISRRIGAAAALAAAITLGVTACGGGADPGQSGGDGGTGGLEKLTVATYGLSSDGALLMGIEQGFFKEEGIEIETTLLANPPAALAAAQSGQVDITVTPAIPLINGLTQGIKLKVLAPDNGFAPGATTAEDPFEFGETELIASKKSGIKALKDFEGATIAVPARKAHNEVVATYVLKEAGVDLSSIEWVALDFTSAVAALDNGTIDASVLVSPFSERAMESGNPLISSPGIKFFNGGPSGMWVAGEGTIEKRPEVIAGFQRAIQKSKEYANDHAEEAVQLALEHNKSDLTVDEVKTPFWVPEVTQANLEGYLEKLVDLGFIDQAVSLDGVIWEAP